MQEVKKILLVLSIGIILVGGGVYCWWFMKENKDQNTSKIQEEPYVNPFIGFTVSKKAYPVTYTLEQAKDNLIVINKKHALPPEYIPELIEWDGIRLRSDAMEAYKKLISGAQNDGVYLYAISSYRSYQDQDRLFSDYVKQDGQAKAETYSARPGHSEHQSGLAVDVGLPSGNCKLMICMAETKEGRWLSNNSYKYGFIIRYPEGKEVETGYQFEPWHLRFVGNDVAGWVYESGYTLDSYFGITAGDYVVQATTN